MKFKLLLAAALVTAAGLTLYAVAMPSPRAAWDGENEPESGAELGPPLVEEPLSEDGSLDVGVTTSMFEEEVPTALAQAGYMPLPKTAGALSWRTVHFHPETPTAIRTAVQEVVAILNELPYYNLTFGEDKTGHALKGEIVISVSDTACEGSLGCAQNTRTLHNGEMVASATRIRFASRLETHAALKAMVLHEFGHAFGLDHHTEAYQGQRQIMHELVQNDMTTYREGDVAGLVAMARTP